MKLHSLLLIPIVTVALAPSSLSAMKAGELAATPEGSDAPRLDVVFCVDTTGSMSDEINVVKQKLREMIANVSAGDPTPDVRFGLVIYRDRGDEYVTKRYQLTRDIDQVVAWINDIVATGGNDYPESLNEALHVAVQEMAWDTTPDVGRLIFLIADAPPHMDYEGDYDYHKESEAALDQGIIIDTIGCSGLKEPDQAIFEQIAGLTLGSFELLTYMREYVKEGGKRGIVVTAGEALYVLGEDVEGEEWREGARRLEGRGLVAKLPDADVARHAAVMPPAGGAIDDLTETKGDKAIAGREVAGETLAMGFPYRSTTTDYPAAVGKPAAAPAPGGPAGHRSMGELAAKVRATENNLDSLLTRQVQLQLSRQGVRFDDQPYLPTKEWRGGTCAQTKRRALIARTDTEWKAIWALVADAEGSPQPPPINFRRDMILAAFGGEGWKGRSVRIEDVWADEDGLHARVARGRDDAAALAPYHIIVVARFEGSVTWK